MSRTRLSTSSPAAVSRAIAVPLRDRVAHVYHVVFTRRLNYTVLATSLLLVLGSVWRPTVVLSAWYDACEAMLTLFFVMEVLLRFAVMRSRFGESVVNIVEAVLCAVCVVLFSFLHVNRLVSATTVQEHRVLLLLRAVSQSVRVLGVLAHELLTRHAATTSMRGLHAFSVGADVVLPPSTSSPLLHNTRPFHRV